MANEEKLDPKVNLTGEDALSVESGDDISAQVDLNQIQVAGTKTDKTTTNAYADLAVFKLSGYNKATFGIVNSGATNALHYKLLGSLDNGKTFDVAVSAVDQSVALSTTGVVNWFSTGTAPANGVYTHIKVQVKAAVGNAQTTAGARAAFSA